MSPLSGSAEGALPELAAVYWRPLASDRSLTRTGRLWTLTTVAHTLPFVAAAGLLVALKPITAPVALVLLAHAWIIPELYAARGTNVVRSRGGSATAAERTALGLLGDLVGHDAREVHKRTGLVIERGTLGVWLVGEAGALLVRPGARRVHCYCVRATDPGSPPAIGRRISCWRSEPTSRGSRPSPTSPSRAPDGACGGGSRGPCARRLTAPAPRARADSRVGRAHP